MSDYISHTKGEEKKVCILYSNRNQTQVTTGPKFSSGQYKFKTAAQPFQNPQSHVSPITEHELTGNLRFIFC